MAPPGRPPKDAPVFTEQRVADILSSVEQGRTLKHACALASVSDRSFRRWMEQGQRELEDGEETPHAALWKRFEVVRGERLFFLQSIALMGDASPATSARWLMERLDPDTFRLTTRAELSGPEGGPIESCAYVVMLPPLGEGDDEPPGEAR